MKRKSNAGARMIWWSVLIFAMIIGLCYYFKEEELCPSEIVEKVVETVKEKVMEQETTINVVKLGDLEISEQLLTVNEYSRPGRKLSEVTGIVIHYTGNPNTTAVANRNYFQSLAYDKTTYASSHFVVGLEGEIIQCIPLDEEAIATRSRNTDTIGIEVCHPDAEGKFNDVTYEKVIQLVAELCKEYQLTEDDVIRHHDVTGKICPKYYVEHEDAWETMKKDIGEELDRRKGI